jgi:hypothetical protein
MEFPTVLYYLLPVLLVASYLYHLNNVLDRTPEEITKVAEKPWTKEQLRAAYEKCQKERPNFTKYLPPKQNRRYIVFGGSGMISILLVSPSG